VLRQIALFDKCARPDFFQQLIFGDDAALPLHQQEKDVKRFLRERDQLAAALQNALRHINLKSIEVIDVFDGLGHKDLKTI
jgi:hypothetical protein